MSDRLRSPRSEPDDSEGKIYEHRVSGITSGSEIVQIEVAWIALGTSTGRTITAAIPPVFEAYATIVRPDTGEEQEAHDGPCSLC